MATYCQNKTIRWKDERGLWHILNNARLCVTPSGSQAMVDLTVTNNTFNWKMQLQRYRASDKTWYTVGERTGWVSPSSPSNRTFTNIAKKNTALRVRVTLWWAQDNSYVGWIDSTQWMR